MLRLRKSIFQMSKPILVAFDFDHTIADQNTDIVVRDLLPREKITDDVTKLYRSDGWTAYMQKIFFLLHENGITPETIEEAVKKIPVTAGVDKLLKFLHQTNNEVIIISDSNSVFIRKWLEATCLNYTVQKVFTNPAHYDDNGCLRIQMYHTQVRFCVTLIEHTNKYKILFCCQACLQLIVLKIYFLGSVSYGTLSSQAS
ncbi:pyridoxal phosphate phosphatase PHOSPHO2-like [Schistocerca nitens]|uniref:pyridoxal phosphate phosphatase PHOSPHO2-like n=1 Tax=Schistocerca nitens TaxID=7011 RepID=UPI0021181583|nr:pyridoxal phosphate phosphatase PHOSPHO2-like [Schistocerca nitens]